MEYSLLFEDVLILLSIIALFVLGVFFSDRAWAQVILAVILIVMFAVFIRRIKRIKGVLQDKENE